MKQTSLDLEPSALDDSGELLALLDAWVACGWLRELDRALAALLAELEEDASPLLLLAAALASHQLGHGHVCLDLHATLADPDFALSLPPEGEPGGALLPSRQLARLTAGAWRAALAASRLVAVSGERHDTPLVLDGHSLYLRRYWTYEQRVAAAIGERLASARQIPQDLPQRLQRLFPQGPGTPRSDWQKLACALATRSSFSVITGGPGTGKTTTVVRLLALLQGAAQEAGRPLRIALAAPTGKAAARLTESIGAQVAGLDIDESVRQAIPSEVTTLHRLLGSLPGSRHFRHHAGNPLALDVLVVDEASMIDLEMMDNLLAALPTQARLVLLGDKDQLASVEAGALLGDLCRDAEPGHYDPATRAWLEAQSGQPLDADELLPGTAWQYPLEQHTVMLRHSRRFGAHSGIGQLARAVNRRDADQALATLREPHDDLYRLNLRSAQDPALEHLLLDGHGQAGGYTHYLQRLHETRPAPTLAADDPAWARWAGGVLQAFDGFRLLCAIRRGDWGVAGLNLRIAQALGRRGLIDASTPWYEGRPVLMTHNDYSLGLMNGDIGIALCLPEPDQQPGQPPRQVLRVAFPRNDGSAGLRYILPSRLSAVETVFAMTVHKSQGSEFEHTALLLPERLNPVLTKELIYTAITRARSHFSLIEQRESVFDQATRRAVERRSGLLRTLRERNPAPETP
ncbi:exodeoxyribonuclease V subunit alpha [Stutzerimonas kirkiae]|uniref:RecBCD enzyme subunit RecD n=1 Tax=Stutzerimonas kirkiae TaxID=2211392 RepID=A0A4Q9QZU5_9GAMM|nr:exodeoxyribonuclease V subunit alpha [Stutzerimonas kirkiae]TBU90343.1 exodeoxyribonuclease V subunit alpha [Stutzerimonas kirkiae]TBU99578.1 exodeoxyribonuclease V subunit alpha [Stutzerimonas kirkiae]